MSRCKTTFSKFPYAILSEGGVKFPKPACLCVCVKSIMNGKEERQVCLDCDV